MATVKRDTTVSASGEEIWTKLIQDPNRWQDWLTPLRGLEEKVTPPVSSGTLFAARIGNLSGKIKVVEAVTGKKLRWKAGPGPLLAMGMGMKGTLELHPRNGATHVHLTMKSPPGLNHLQVDREAKESRGVLRRLTFRWPSAMREVMSRFTKVAGFRARLT